MASATTPPDTSTPVPTGDVSVPNAATASPLREDVIKGAVEFLLHPKVVGSSTDKKMKFLKQKGLSVEEIEEATKRAGAKAGAVQSPPTSPVGVNTNAVSKYQPQYVAQPQYYSPLPPPAPIPPPVLYPSLKVIAVVMVLASGLGYTLFYVIKKYIINFWFPPKNKQLLTNVQEQVQSIQEKVQTQSDDVKEAVTVVKNFLTTHIDTYSEHKRIEDLKMQQAKTKASELKKEVGLVQALLPSVTNQLKSHNNLTVTDDLNEIKSDISSIKTVMHTLFKDGTTSEKAKRTSPWVKPDNYVIPAKRQAPVTEQPKTAAIPTWQLQEQTTSTETVPETVENVEAEKSEKLSNGDASEVKPDEPVYSANYQDVVNKLQRGEMPSDIRTDINDKPADPTAPFEQKGSIAPKPKPWEKSVEN